MVADFHIGDRRRAGNRRPPTTQPTQSDWPRAKDATDAKVSEPFPSGHRCALGELCARRLEYGPGPQGRGPSLGFLATHKMTGLEIGPDCRVGSLIPPKVVAGFLIGTGVGLETDAHP